MLSNTQLSPMDMDQKELIEEVVARSFNTSFTRHMNTARELYGRHLDMPILTTKEIIVELKPLLEYYSECDRDIVPDRVITCIMSRQKFNK